MSTKLAGLIAGLFLLSARLASAETIVIATVDNGDMIRMQRLSEDFSRQHPDIDLEWVTLEENVLRQRVTNDITNRGGKYDVMTIGTYEVPIWAKQGWLVPLEDLGPAYDIDDLLPPIRAGLSHEGSLYAAPFYGESTMVMYRTDLFEAAGLTMPRAPDWAFIADAARKITDRENDVYGICVRGKAGWGENMAFLTATANSFGARWFDEDWQPQLDSEAWSETLNFYVDLLNDAGPPKAVANGFTENLALFQAGKCGIWIDATVAASFISDPNESQVTDRIGFALAPGTDLGKRSNWLWAWSLAIPASSEKVEAAKTFIAWATGKGYIELVAENEGWANVPPGTRTSLYQNPNYADVAPFAEITLESITSADPLNPTVDPAPYVGIQFVAIPEFQCIATSVGQQFALVLSGEMSVDDGLASAQRIAVHKMTTGGYLQ